MARHGLTQEHVPQRRWSTLGRKRCSCGKPLPCVVRATLERQRHFVGDAAPGWSATPTAIARAAVRPAVPATTDVPAPSWGDRPLLTLGQLSCSEPAAAQQLYGDGLAAAREWQRDERRRWARGAR